MILIADVRIGVQFPTPMSAVTVRNSVTSLDRSALLSPHLIDHYYLVDINEKIISLRAGVGNYPTLHL
jgi:hypothetical protein